MRILTIECLTFLSFVSIVFCFSAVPSYAAEENACIACHADVGKPGKSVHAALKTGCPSCHKSVEGKDHPDERGSIVLEQKIPGLCYGCHEESKFKGKSGHTRLGMCTGCHNPHRSDADKLLKSGQPDVCYACHDKAKFTKKYTHRIIEVAGCTACHAPHVSDYPFLLFTSAQDLCISCHKAKLKSPHVVALPGRKRHPIDGVIDPSTQKMVKIPDPKKPGKMIEVPDPDVPGKEMSCGSCHLPHSSDFRALFPEERICLRCHKF